MTSMSRGTRLYRPPLLAAEEDRAGLATADELAAGRLEQMRMLGRQREPAQLAVLGRAGRGFRTNCRSVDIGLRAGVDVRLHER